MNDDNSWKFRAACNTTSPETDHWYTPTRIPGEKREAKGAKKARLQLALAACDTCPVRRECGDAGRDEEHGIWGGVDKAAAKPKPKRETRRTSDANQAAIQRARDAQSVAHQAAFDEFVETITVLHLQGATLADVLDHTGYERQAFYNRLNRRNRLDLYSMLTGAAT